jgi:hypothetical protein
LDNDNLDTLGLVIDQFTSTNAALRITNKLLGVRLEDHTIPIRELEAASKMPKSNETYGDCLAAFGYKMSLLKIPGHQTICSSIKFALDKHRELEARKQVLGLIETVLPGEIVENVPMWSIERFSSLYSNCCYQRTVGWGEKNRRNWYINQYGPPSAPLWRIERQPVETSRNSWIGLGPPRSAKVDNCANRYGDLKKVNSN